MLKEIELPPFATVPKTLRRPAARNGDIVSEIREFSDFGARSRELGTRSSDGKLTVPTFVHEFWAAGERAADNLHEVSYRGSFKPQLPRFFIERLTAPGE